MRCLFVLLFICVCICIGMAVSASAQTCNCDSCAASDIYQCGQWSKIESVNWPAGGTTYPLQAIHMVLTKGGTSGGPSASF